MGEGLPASLIYHPQNWYCYILFYVCVNLHNTSNNAVIYGLDPDALNDQAVYVNKRNTCLI